MNWFLPAGRLLPWLIGLSIVLAWPVLAQNASEILGPDGNYYPDWRGVGVQGGIPVVTNTIATITPAQAASNLAGAIQSAVTSATSSGLIILPTGAWSLTQPVFINKNGIVISGGDSTSNGTTINFTWPGQSGTTPVFFQPPAGKTTLYENTWISAQARPAGLTQMDLYAGPPGTTLKLIAFANINLGVHMISCDCTGETILDQFSQTSGTYVVQAVAHYGSVSSTTTNTYFFSTGMDSVASDPTFYSMPGYVDNPYLGAFNFTAQGNLGASYKALVATANPGDATIHVNYAGLAAGQQIDLYAPNDPDFNEATGNTCVNGWFREYQFVVTSASGTAITLNQPLRISFPVDTTEPASDAPYATAIQTIQNCGVQNLTLNQTNTVWTSGFIFAWAWNCWVENIAVNNVGRYPVWFSPGKWCEMSDCSFNGACYLDAGNAYVGFERSYDCLMQNITSSNLRHGPILQWSTAGTVVRNSTFIDTDPQWHAGWANNNLYENNTILSNLLAETPDPSSGLSGAGSYGDTGYASAPTDDIHGPEGPCDVIYNNDISGPAYGIFMGGANDGWTFLWNRFAVDGQDGNGYGIGYYNQGPCLGFGMYFQEASTDALVADNVFLLAESPLAVDISDTNSIGNVFIDNQFIGTFNPTYALFTRPAMTGSGSTGNTATDQLQPLTFPNGGFETSDLTDWNNSGDGGASTVSPAAAYSGTYGLHVVVTSTTADSSLYSSLINVSLGFTYATRFMYMVNSGTNDCGVYMYFYNSAGQAFPNPQNISLTSTSWTPVMISWEAPAGAVTAKIWIHDYYGDKCNVYLDNFEFGVINKLANANVPFDAGFEGGEWVGWNNSNDNGMSSIIVDSTNANNHLLQVADNSTTLGASLVSSSFPVTAYLDYQARFSAVNTYGTGFAVWLKFYNSGGAYLSGNQFSLPGDLNWRQYVLRAEAPPGAATGQLSIVSSVSETGTEDFDNFTVLQLPPRPVPSGNSPASIYDWELFPIYYLGNRDFETGDLSYWNNSGDNRMSSVTEAAAYSGNYGLQVLDTSTSAGSSLISLGSPAAAGVQFQLTFWAKIVSGTGGMGAYVQFLSGSGGILNSYEVPVPSTTTSWTRFQQTFTAPVNAATVRIWVSSSVAGTVTAEFDDFLLSQVIPDGRTNVVQASFAEWQNSWFTPSALADPAVSDDTADPTGDGISNLMKYALNLNPNLPVVSGLPASGLVTVGSSNYLTLSYAEVLGATDLTYTPEVSGDLINWATGPGNTVQLSATSSGDGVTERVVARDAVPMSGTNARFMRLEVTGP